MFSTHTQRADKYSYEYINYFDDGNHFTIHASKYHILYSKPYTDFIHQSKTP